jgi:HAD superfamily hydrolase (TIGR01509 family)
MATKGLILDIDGTLVDSNDAHTRAWLDALSEEGFSVPYQRVRRLIGMGGDKLLPEVTGLSEDDPRGQRLAKRRGEIFKERYLKTVKAFPCVRELLLRARDSGFTLAVATSAKEEEVGPLLEKARVLDLIPHKTSSDDADNSKPDPDIVKAALQRLGCAPEHALMLGDTPYDVEAARRAAVRAVALRCGGWDDEGLRDAAAIYEDPEELLARFSESPLGEP